MDSQLEEHNALYSAFLVLGDTLECFLLSHEIMVDPRLKHPPEVLFLLETLPAQSKFV